VEAGLNGKQPYCFEVGDGAIFEFAGLWDRWQASDGTPVETCTILTTTPNELLAGVHNRMPVILPRDVYHTWLDPGIQDETVAVEMLRPFRANPYAAISGEPVGQPRGQ
jgi:putative SOS response-associated peptidase YedK